MKEEDPLLIVSIDIGDGRVDELIVYENSEPEKLAEAFSKIHNLEPRMKRGLQRYIRKLVKGQISNHSESSSQVTEVSVTSATSCGERLYSNGRIMQQLKSKRSASLKKKLEQQEDIQLTFQPKINPVSKVLGQNVMRRNKKVQKAIFEKIAREKENCTFNPQINHYSKKILDGKRDQSKDRFLQLYEQATQRSKKLVHLQQNSGFSFQPSVNNSVTEDKQNIFDRLYRPPKKPKQRPEHKDLFDPVTGQQFFKPIICRHPHTQKRPVVQRLYSKSKPSSLAPTLQSTVNSISQSKHSQKILLKAKYHRFSELFRHLSPDGLGQISYSKIKQEEINPVLQQLLKPFFQELELIGEKLNFQDFYQAMENLLLSLTPDQKRILVSKKYQIKKEEESKKPPRSQSLGRRLYERGMERHQSREKEIIRRKIEKQEAELESCTFFPQTTQYKKPPSYNRFFNL